jgi:putative SOS response-associated peptidase YedK
MRRFAQAIATAESLPAGLPDVLSTALTQGPDRYNVAKGKPALVLAINAEGKLCVAEMIWGLVPRWSREPFTPYTTVTARLERAPKSRIFSQAWKERPCVVPVTGYYKWDRQRKPPWPRFIQRQDGITLLAAGLWETWDREEGNALHSFALLTAPNMSIPPPLTQDGPVFLGMAEALRWLRGSLSSPRSVMRHAQRPLLESFPVSRGISDPTREEYTLLEPVDPDEAAMNSIEEYSVEEVDDDD